MLAGQYDDEVTRGLAQIRQERKDYLAALTKA
jgi:hypothetical protein